MDSTLNLDLWKADLVRLAAKKLAQLTPITIAHEPQRLSAAELAPMIDHTLLRAEATRAMVTKLCAEARTYHFAAVCVNPYYVEQAAQELGGSGVMVASVAGFPLGATMPAVKACEAAQAIEAGAREIDMVLNVGALKSGEYLAVREDMEAVVQACHDRGAICKVILETAYLTDIEKVIACLLAVQARVDFVKTSTGLGPSGATAHDVALMLAVVGPQVGVKAAGGIRDYATALAMVQTGASRIGTSAGIAILQGAPA